MTEGTVIGTNGDGVSDSDERNIFGHVVYDHLGEFYSSSVNAVLAGNYFGVGVDGVTPSPMSTNINPDFVEFGGSIAQVRIGSNGDGISDDLEGNLIVNVPADVLFGKFGNPGCLPRQQAGELRRRWRSVCRR
ncbi:MAG: hypothetical protein IPK15_07275 [Verrucomicrobia bacterium]|nr:hypothetical protein [Verrucomicrobiota bacterium]